MAHRGHAAQEVGIITYCILYHDLKDINFRDAGRECLKHWDELIRSGQYTSDQECMDVAEKQGYCRFILPLPSRHLLFAKDYAAMLLTSSRTFLHLTAASRMHTQDAFYRDLVVPWVVGGLTNRMDHRERALFDGQAKYKTCNPIVGVMPASSAMQK